MVLSTLAKLHRLRISIILLLSCSCLATAVFIDGKGSPNRARLSKQSSLAEIIEAALIGSGGPLEEYRDQLEKRSSITKSISNGFSIHRHELISTLLPDDPQTRKLRQSPDPWQKKTSPKAKKEKKTKSTPKSSPNPISNILRNDFSKQIDKQTPKPLASKSPQPLASIPRKPQSSKSPKYAISNTPAPYASTHRNKLGTKTTPMKPKTYASKSPRPFTPKKSKPTKSSKVTKVSPTYKPCSAHSRNIQKHHFKSKSSKWNKKATKKHFKKTGGDLSGKKGKYRKKKLSQKSNSLNSTTPVGFPEKKQFQNRINKTIPKNEYEKREARLGLKERKNIRKEKTNRKKVAKKIQKMGMGHLTNYTTTGNRLSSKIDSNVTKVYYKEHKKECHNESYYAFKRLHNNGTKPIMLVINESRQMRSMASETDSEDEPWKKDHNRIINHTSLNSPHKTLDVKGNWTKAHSRPITTTTPEVEEISSKRYRVMKKRMPEIYLDYQAPLQKTGGSLDTKVSILKNNSQPHKKRSGNRISAILFGLNDDPMETAEPELEPSFEPIPDNFLDVQFSEKPDSLLSVLNILKSLLEKNEATSLKRGFDPILAKKLSNISKSLKSQSINYYSDSDKAAKQIGKLKLRVRNMVNTGRMKNYWSPILISLNEIENPDVLDLQPSPENELPIESDQPIFLSFFTVDVFVTHPVKYNPRNVSNFIMKKSTSYLNIKRQQLTIFKNVPVESGNNGTSSFGLVLKVKCKETNCDSSKDKYTKYIDNGNMTSSLASSKYSGSNIELKSISALAKDVEEPDIVSDNKLKMAKWQIALLGAAGVTGLCLVVLILTMVFKGHRENDDYSLSQGNNLGGAMKSMRMRWSNETSETKSDSFIFSNFGGRSRSDSAISPWMQEMHPSELGSMTTSGSYSEGDDKIEVAGSQMYPGDPDLDANDEEQGIQRVPTLKDNWGRA